MGLLTHGLRGLLLLLQLPLEGGHLGLQVTCFYDSRERGPSKSLLGLASGIMPSVPYRVVAAVTVWRGCLGLWEELWGGLRRPGPHLPCFLLAGCHASTPLWAPEVTVRLRKGRDLPKSSGFITAGPGPGPVP